MVFVGSGNGSPDNSRTSGVQVGAMGLKCQNARRETAGEFWFCRTEVSKGCPIYTEPSPKDPLVTLVIFQVGWHPIGTLAADRPPQLSPRRLTFDFGHRCFCSPTVDFLKRAHGISLRPCLNSLHIPGRNMTHLCDMVENGETRIPD